LLSQSVNLVIGSSALLCTCVVWIELSLSQLYIALCSGTCLDVTCVVSFLVKDDDDDESETAVKPAASCRTDSSVSQSFASLQPAEIFAANSGTASFQCCSLEVSNFTCCVVTAPVLMIHQYYQFVA